MAANPKPNSDPFNLTRWAQWLIGAAGLLAYANSFGGAFVFDDRSQILGHHFPAAFTSQLLTRSRPLGYLSFAINHALHGKDVAGYHAVNLAIHLGSGWLLYVGLRRVLTLASHPSATSLAFVSSLWWVVHPLQTQSVTYIIQRYESMAGLFYLACVVLFLKGLERRHWSWYLLSAGCCWLGMLTKEILLTAPWLILAFDRVLVPGSWRELALRRGWYYLLMLSSVSVVGWQMATATSLTRGGAFRVEGLTTWEYARTQPEVILHYLRLALWPRGLCLDYGWPVANSWLEIVPAGVVVLGLLGITVVGWWRGTYWSLLGIWFFFILATTSSVLVIKDLAVEHRMYLSLAAVTTLAACGGNALCDYCSRRGNWTNSTTRQFKTAGVVAITSGLIALTVARNFDYYSWQGMWADVVAKAPRNGRGYIALGIGCIEDDYAESTRWHRQGLELDPHNYLGHRGLAQLLFNQDKVEEAWPHIRFLQESEFYKGEGYTLAGMAHRRQEQLAEAEQCFRTAYEHDPELPLLNFEYAQLMFGLKKYAAAERLVMAGLALEPNNAEGCNLRGILGITAKQPVDAEGWFRKAAALDPKNEGFRQNLMRVQETLRKAGRR